MTQASVPASVRLQRSGAVATALRLAIALALVTALAPTLQQPLIDQLLPAWRLTIESIEPDFRVLNLATIQEAHRSVIEVDVTPARYMIIGGRTVAPDPAARATSSTPRGAVWLVVAVFAVAVIVWPTVRPARELGLRLLFGLPLLAAILLVDVPITLVGPLRAMLIETLDPKGWDFWAVSSEFLRSGGRYLMTMMVATLACAAARAGSCAQPSARSS